jgi:hypothetical protein
MTCVATADTRTLKRALYEKTLIALSTSNDGRNNVGRNDDGRNNDGRNNDGRNNDGRNNDGRSVRLQPDREPQFAG